MAETVDVFGKPVKKQTLLIGGVVVIGGGYILIRRKNSAAAAAAAATNTDTGSTTASQDTGANLSEIPGDSSSYVSGDGSVIGYDPAGNPIYGTGAGGSGVPVNSGPGTYTNNAQWTQAVEQLMGSDGTDAIAAALGKYITGQPMTDAQVTIVQEAIASEGYPPVAGSGGDPPNYKTTNPSPGTPPGGTGTGTVRVPNVVGLRAVPAKAKITAAGLKPDQDPAPIQGKEMKIISTTPKAGAKVKKGSVVTLHAKVV